MTTSTRSPARSPANAGSSCRGSIDRVDDRHAELARRRDPVVAPGDEAAGHRVLGEVRMGPLVDVVVDPVAPVLEELRRGPGVVDLVEVHLVRLGQAEHPDAEDRRRRGRRGSTGRAGRAGPPGSSWRARERSARTGRSASCARNQPIGPSSPNDGGSVQVGHRRRAARAPARRRPRRRRRRRSGRRARPPDVDRRAVDAAGRPASGPAIARTAPSPAPVQTSSSSGHASSAATASAAAPASSSPLERALRRRAGAGRTPRARRRAPSGRSIVTPVVARGSPAPIPSQSLIPGLSG